MPKIFINSPQTNKALYPRVDKRYNSAWADIINNERQERKNYQNGGQKVDPMFFDHIERFF